MKKWLIPLGALIIIAAMVFAVKHYVIGRTEMGYYKLYMVAIGDKGKLGQKIGCGDSLVEVKRQTVTDTKMSDVYQDLLGDRDRDYDTDLKNPLWQSDLTLNSATVDSKGVAHILLSGTVSLAGSCDAARIKGQLEKPALQFDGVKSVEVKINNQPLDSLLKA